VTRSFCRDGNLLLTGGCHAEIDTELAASQIQETRVKISRVDSAGSLHQRTLRSGGDKGCSKKQWRFSPPAPPALGKDFNTNWDPKNVDPNGAPRNPDWAPQLQGNIPDPNKCDGGNPYNSPCTDDKPFLDPPNAFADGFCYIGKVSAGARWDFLDTPTGWWLSTTAT
jgi:hypothetical protein